MPCNETEIDVFGVKWNMTWLVGCALAWDYNVEMTCGMLLVKEFHGKLLMIGCLVYAFI